MAAGDVVEPRPRDPNVAGNADPVRRVDVEAARRAHLDSLIDDDGRLAAVSLQVGAERAGCGTGRRIFPAGQVEGERAGAPAPRTLLGDEVVVEGLGIGETGQRRSHGGMIRPRRADRPHLTNRQQQRRQASRADLGGEVRMGVAGPQAHRFEDWSGIDGVAELRRVLFEGHAAQDAFQLDVEALGARWGLLDKRDGRQAKPVGVRRGRPSEG
jgi:hypothetical protein